MLKRIISLLILPVFFVSTMVLAGEQESVRESTVLFKLKTDASPAELKRFNALVNPSTILEMREIEGVAFVVKFRNVKGFEKAFSQQLMTTGAVRFAEPDALIPHAAEPNDTYYYLQWHHATINSPVAWDFLTGPADLNAVKVCVLDTGVDTDHPDLVGNLLLPGYNAPLEISGNVEDVHGHGTKTSGVIGAMGNNGIGVSGMVWDIKIIPVQINISDQNSSAYISDMAVGIEWCASQGVKVVNLSYGGAQYGTIDSAAQVLRNSGGLLFMSAGNDGTYNSSIDYPDYDSFIVVGSTDDEDSISGFSETGPFVDVTAPGEDIATTGISASGDSGYYYATGTSFSSPMTAGLAALIYSINPEFTPAEVENYILNTAVDLGDAGDDDIYGHGRIDAGAAVASAWNISPNEPPVAVALATSLTSGIAPFEVAFDGSDSSDDGTIESYVWDFGDGNSVSGATVTHTYNVAGTFDATLTVTDDRAAQTTSAAIVINVAPDPNQIDAPSNLTASVDTNNVTLSWTHNLNNITGFEVFRAQKIRGKYNYSLLDITGGVNTYVDIAEAGNYRYKVRAISSGSPPTEFSNVVSATVEKASTEPDPGTLSAPSLSASSAGLTVTLTWTHACPSGEVCTYYIERGDRKVKGNINWAPIASGIGGSSYVYGESSKGTYYYKVHASTGTDTSADSNTVNVRLR
ncbi:MAG: S8 family serine peptidase [Piscirickettsiaceae bacterium]|nr:S8 family serine peptidase [Piscirickettsiaceae bacterium]